MNVSDMKPTRFAKSEFTRKMAGYRKFLRQDFDWDWAYILRLLSYKLSRTRRCLSLGKGRDARRIGRHIRQVENLLERVIEDKYYDRISQGLRKKYGRLRMIYGKPPLRQNGNFVTFRYDRETPQNRHKIAKATAHFMRRAEQMRRNDLRRAFRLMEQHIWNWWN